MFTPLDDGSYNLLMNEKPVNASDTPTFGREEIAVVWGVGVPQ